MINNMIIYHLISQDTTYVTPTIQSPLITLSSQPSFVNYTEGTVVNYYLTVPLQTVVKWM